LLGYSPDQFSVKVLETFDSLRLEQALEILLACYRDIRYSVSPRFELETAVSKLSWLSQWVSPPELKAALDRAQYALGAQAGSGYAPEGGLARPLATGTLVPGTKVPENPKHPPRQEKNGVPSLAQEYRRMLAEKAKSPGAVPLSDVDEVEDDEEPAWSGIIHNSGTSPGDESPSDESPVDRVLRLIPGTVVN
jgi:DNA polymerase-3 subunit gamma/tau